MGLFIKAMLLWSLEIHLKWRSHVSVPPPAPPSTPPSSPQDQSAKIWSVKSSKEIFKTNFYRLRSDQCELPSGKIMPNYYVMEFPDWVNVVALTPEDRVIMIEQYRHAIGKTTLEFPGGTATPGAGEPAEKAALRELREETGYLPEEIRLVGKHRPNPALQNNSMHTFVALGCVPDGPQELDPFEDIKVVTMSLQEVINAAFDGRIEHSLMIASLFQALRFLGFHLP